MKTVLITGGARGIGKGIAEKFKKSGYNTVINYFSSEEEAKKLSKEGCFCVQADVGSKKEVEAMFGKIHDKFGKVDVLINNAGIALLQKVFMDVTEEEFDRLFAVDVKGVFNCSAYAVKDMLAAGHGKIVNISSVWGDEGAACEACYSAAKGAVISFTKSIAKELEGVVDVNAVLPGFIETDMNAHLSKEDKINFMISRGIVRFATVNDVANKVFKLAQSSCTGRIVKVYGRKK